MNTNWFHIVHLYEREVARTFPSVLDGRGLEATRPTPSPHTEVRPLSAAGAAPLKPDKFRPNIDWGPTIEFRVTTRASGLTPA